MKLYHTLIVFALAFSAKAQAQQAEPPGEVIVCCTDKDGIIDIIDGRLVYAPVENSAARCTVSFSSQGEYYVRYKDNAFILVEMKNGRPEPVRDIGKKFVLQTLPQEAGNDAGVMLQ